MFSKNSIIGIVDSGAMGSGIAQVAATAGHKVLVFDNNKAALARSADHLNASLNKLVEKQKLDTEKQKAILSSCTFVDELSTFSECDLVIEAIIENLAIKKDLFLKLESLVKKECILATNTSSLSITSIGAACKNPSKLIGIHFFNPATLMP